MSGTPGSCGFPVSRTPGSQESTVSWTPWSRVSPVSRTPGIKFFLLFFKLQANLPSSGTPRIRESPVSQTSGSRDSLVSGTPVSRESPGSQAPGSHFLSVHCFFKTSTHCYRHKRNNQPKKHCVSIIYYTKTFGLCLKKFPSFIIYVATPSVSDAGESFESINISPKNC